jgi:hypothetical protein
MLQPEVVFSLQNAQIATQQTLHRARYLKATQTHTKKNDINDSQQLTG